MRTSARLIRLAALALLVTGVVFVVSGCPRHEDFPQPLDTQPVPTPFDFVITQPDSLAYDYDFAWDIDDPQGVVDRYHIYLVGTGGAPDEFLAQTQQTTFLATFPFSVGGYRFAVAAVSTEHIEGTRVSRVAP